MSCGGKSIVLVLVLVFGLACPVLAAERDDKRPADQISVTRHTLMLQGKKVNYTATVGYLTLQDEQQRPNANIFFNAYTLDDAKLATRPVTFAFNGGPGSSSVWLHLGLLGPKRVKMKDNGDPPPPPYKLI